MSLHRSSVNVDSLGNQMPDSALSTAFELIRTVWNLHVFDIPTMIAVCKSDSIIERLVGTQFFEDFYSNNPGDLAEFLFTINEHPPLAKYVRSVTLTESLDTGHASCVYEMLLAIHAHIANIESDFGDDNFAKTSSPLLLKWSEEFFLYSIGGIENIPENVHFAVISSLFRIAKDVVKVEMPESWDGMFDVDRLFPKCLQVVLVEDVGEN